MFYVDSVQGFISGFGFRERDIQGFRFRVSDFGVGVSQILPALRRRAPVFPSISREASASISEYSTTRAPPSAVGDGIQNP